MKCSGVQQFRAVRASKDRSPSAATAGEWIAPILSDNLLGISLFVNLTGDARVKSFIPSPKASLRAFGVLCGSLLSQILLAAPPIELEQAESAARPVPDWVKMIDQGGNDERLKGYTTPAGIKLEIVADFPVVTNPVGMTFADDGSLYVLEWRQGEERSETVTYTYKDGSKHNITRITKSVKDVVKVLRTKGQGAYDQSQVILEEQLPSGILIHDGWLYLSGGGDVHRYKLADIKAEEKAEAPKAEVIVRGFGGVHHHQVSGLTIGNDGWLYVSVGDGDHVLEGSDGSRATVLRTGAIFRCRPDGSKIATVSIGYCNPYRDVAFDAAFNMFHIDNDSNDGGKFAGCRLMHVAEESDFGWRRRADSQKADRLRAAAFGELPGKMLPMLKTGRGAPAGLFIYNDTRFSAEFRGLLYYPDVLRKLVRAYRVSARGSTFAVTEEFELLRSADPLFRPCQMVVGPDGAMYVCDWRSGSDGSGQLAGDGKHGRIYRLSWTGVGDQAALPLRGLDSWAKIIKLSDEELLKALGSEDFSDRLRAQRELVRRGDKVRPALLRMVLFPHLDEKEHAEGEARELVKEEPPAAARIAALGALETTWSEKTQDAFARLLRDPQVAIRRLAIEGLARNAKKGDVQVSESLLRLLEEPDLAIRRAAFLALGQVGAPEAADTLANAFKFDEGKDAYLTDGVLRAIERAGKPGIAKLVALAESGDEKDHDKVLEAFPSLRTRAAADAIPGLLKYPHLTPRQQADLLRSYSNYLVEPPMSMEPVLEYLLTHEDAPPPVRQAGLEVLAGTPLLKNGKGEKLVLAMLQDRDATLRVAAIHAIGESGVEKGAAEVLKVLENSQLLASERAVAATALGTLKYREAVPALKKAIATDLAKFDAVDRNLVVTLYLESLRALAALDPDEADRAAQAFLGYDDATLRKEAIALLGRKPQGARLVAEQFLSKKLPTALLPNVRAVVRRHAAKDAELAKLLEQLMPK
jgi:putative membrane-bound dehydrogenase-like protein